MKREKGEREWGGEREQERERDRARYSRKRDRKIQISRKPEREKLE